MANPQPTIVWFRDDLHLSDHPALHAASSIGAPVKSARSACPKSATRRTTAPGQKAAEAFVSNDEARFGASVSPVITPESG
jgi:deoxyribodipyrimidine photolyase